MINTVEGKRYDTREEWLAARTSTIGGSDAGVILGVCPWKTNEELWEEKVGLKKPADVSDNPLVKYGTEAEKHLRGLFALDYPQYEVVYSENNIWTNDKYPFAHASLDGWMIEWAESNRLEDNRHGILEIKTATISSKAQKEKWAGNHIPQNYYAQILHYFIVTEADFAILKAQLKYEVEGEEPFLHTKHYRIERTDVEEDINILLEKEQEFVDMVLSKTRPNTVLPEI